MVFLWFSYGFPMVFLWFSYGFRCEDARMLEITLPSHPRMLVNIMRHCEEPGKYFVLLKDDAWRHPQEGLGETTKRPAKWQGWMAATHEGGQQMGFFVILSILSRGNGDLKDVQAKMVIKKSKNMISCRNDTAEPAPFYGDVHVWCTVSGLAGEGPRFGCPKLASFQRKGPPGARRQDQLSLDVGWWKSAWNWRGCTSYETIRILQRELMMVYESYTINSRFLQVKFLLLSYMMVIRSTDWFDFFFSTGITASSVPRVQVFSVSQCHHLHPYPPTALFFCFSYQD